MEISVAHLILENGDERGTDLNDFCLDLISTYFRGAISIPATYLDIKDEVIPLFLFISFFLQYTPRAIMIKESSFFFRIFD